MTNISKYKQDYLHEKYYCIQVCILTEKNTSLLDLLTICCCYWFNDTISLLCLAGCIVCNGLWQHQLTVRANPGLEKNVYIYVYMCMCTHASAWIPASLAWPHFSADINQIWHGASLHPNNSHRCGVEFLTSLNLVGVLAKMNFSNSQYLDMPCYGTKWFPTANNWTHHNHGANSRWVANS